MANDAKKLIDQGLGTAITCSFAIPEVGPAIAGVLAVGKMFVDMFYPKDKTGKDPMQRLPTMADLTNAVNGLKAATATEIWNSTKNAKQADVLTMSDAIIRKMKNAGASPKKGQPLPGDTAVWDSSAETVKFFDPIMGNPSPLQDVANVIEQKASEKYKTVGLYTLTVGIYLNYCKTAMIFEVNENLKDYNARLDDWNSKAKAVTQWNLFKQGPKPPAAGPKPTKPIDGDYAVGSEEVDQSTHVVRGYRSYLGKKKGENVSKFAIKARDESKKRTTYLSKVISDWSTAKTDRDSYVQNSLDKAVTVKACPGGYQWVNSINGTKGDVVPVKVLADNQCTIEKSKLRASYELKWNQQNPVPEDLDDADIGKLKQTLAEWQKTMNALKNITQNAGLHN